MDSQIELFLRIVNENPGISPTQVTWLYMLSANDVDVYLNIRGNNEHTMVLNKVKTIIRFSDIPHHVVEYNKDINTIIELKEFWEQQTPAAILTGIDNTIDEHENREITILSINKEGEKKSTDRL